MAHNDLIIDSDGHFIIDPITREITNQSGKTTLMQFDHNSERLTFEVNPIIEGHEMAKSDRVEIHYINIASDKRSQVSDFYPVDDLTFNDDKITFSWLVSRNVTQLAGVVSFAIRFICTDDDKEVYAWNTAKHNSINISEGINNSSAIDEDYSDLINQWYSMLVGSGTEGVNKVEEARNNAIAELSEKKTEILNDIIDKIEKKGAETLNSIPDDYISLNEKIDNVNTECYNRLITNKANGEHILLSDSAEELIKSIKIFGKTTQADTPTVENPQEFVSVGSGGSIKLDIKKKNILPHIYAMGSQTMKGVEFTVNADKSITVNGSAIDVCSFLLLPVGGKKLILPRGEYTVSSGVSNDAASSKFGIAVGYTYFNSSSRTVVYTVNGKASLVLTDNAYVDCVLVVRSGVTLNNAIFKPQIEVGSIATDYETPAVVQSATFNTPNGLRGVPVTRGGYDDNIYNYIDENGQKWICDEIDLVRGKYIQRIGIDEVNIVTVTSSVDVYFPEICYAIHNTSKKKIQSNYVGILSEKAPTVIESAMGAVRENVGNIAFCGSYADDTLETMQAKYNGSKLLYVLETPIETDLTEEEIAQYKALTMNKPITNISNDANANMTVEYIVDTKTYIDNKFEALRVAILGV